MTTSREVRLISRPDGLPTPADFEIATVQVPPPGLGEVQVRNRWMSVDPYMRGRMREGKSYAAPYALNEVMHGGAIGEVVASNDPGLNVGDIVRSQLGWREVFNAPAAALTRIDTTKASETAYLSVLGMAGMTAWYGLLHVASLKERDVVFVSAAAGAVGSAVCQIAKLKGHKVVGATGSDEKAAWLKSLGVDETINYKVEPDLRRALKRTAPEGIDVFFDNVGGAHLDAALIAANANARFALCGAIAGYNRLADASVHNMVLAVGKCIRMEGFIISHHTAQYGAAFERDMVDWISSGKITWTDTVEVGIENAVSAFLKLFAGGNTGKMLVKLT